MPYFTWAHHPHPYYAHRAAFMFHRGPRRFLPKLLWFGLGAGAFAMWSRHHAGSVDSSSKLKQLGMNGEWEHSAHRTTQRQQGVFDDATTLPSSAQQAWSGTTELPAQQSIREVGRQAESVVRSSRSFRSIICSLASAALARSTQIVCFALAAAVILPCWLLSCIVS